jgi:hypothetical protein
MARMETFEVPVDMSEVDRACDKVDMLIDKLKQAQRLISNLGNPWAKPIKESTKVPAIDSTVKPCPRCHSHMVKDTSSFSFPLRTPYICPSCNYREIGP